MTATSMQGDSQAISRGALAALSAAFYAQDGDALLAQFTAAPSATYAGSEAGEVATGHRELRLLFSELFARPERYRFAFDDVRAHASGNGIWLLADGHGYETTSDGEETRFPYRITGVLIFEVDGWRWVLLSGAEPTQVLDPAPSVSQGGRNEPEPLERETSTTEADRSLGRVDAMWIRSRPSRG
jgi:hypothetical protein